MAYYYKVSDGKTPAAPTLDGIQVYEENNEEYKDGRGPSIQYDFSKHVLIELLDNVTSETKLWHELGLTKNKCVTHKRMIVDPHRVNCRRAVVVCSSSDEAKALAERLSQAKIMKRSICAVVIQELISDITLFEKQIIQYGDKRSQHQLVYVTELTRRREPSGLAEYLREKFSPFGTILSVLVSEGKDGCAHPEGVIKFAHLSEAFAAELAYDQCAVALERLSVTTHHNILLSQCDLRARLREAYARHSSEFSFSVISKESQINDKASEDSHSITKILSCNNVSDSGGESEKNESNLNDTGSTVNNNEFPSDSFELADVLQKPCKQSNLIDCLQGIANCSESSISRQTSDGNSLAETEPGTTEQLSLSLNSNNGATTLNKTWSTRIMGWITDLPNFNPTSQADAAASNDIVDKNDAYISEFAILNDKDKNLGCNQQSKLINSIDVVSNTGSFVTCTNGDLNSSFHSPPSSNEAGGSSNASMVEDKTLSHNSKFNPSETLEEETSNVSGSSVWESTTIKSNTNNVSMVEDKALSHDSKFNPSETLEEETSNVSGSSVWESTAIKSNGTPTLSLKRKNSSMMTQKLSLKSKRMHSSQSDTVNEGLDEETTILLPSVPQTKSCSVLLNSVPELDEFVRKMSLERTPVVVLERLCSPCIEGNSEIDEAKVPNIVENKAKSKKYSKKGIGDVSLSVKSQPIRRSSRLTSRGSDKRSRSISSSSLEKNAKPSTSSSNQVDKKENLLNETESPLRIWLKKELESSTNNLVPRNNESTKRIVCATTNKDVLISVGCSHITCDFCYPNSTNLLLGFC